jgi:hypothetical protein
VFIHFTPALVALEVHKYTRPVWVLGLGMLFKSGHIGVYADFGEIIFVNNEVLEMVVN